MKELQNDELVLINGGGLSFTATFLNAFSRSLNTVLEFGRTIGTSIRMIFSKKMC